MPRTLEPLEARAGATAPGGGGALALRDVLAAVPLRHRLATKLLGITAVLAVAGIGALWLAERRMQRDLLDQLERSTALLAEAVQASAQGAMLDARPAHAYDAMAVVAGIEGVDALRILDKRGRITFSSDPGDVGRVVSKAAAGCASCHAGPKPLSRTPAPERSRVERGAHGRVLAVVAPIYNARACATAECHVHPPGRQVLGILELAVSLGPLEGQVRAFRSGFVLLLAAALAALGVLLYLFGRSHVVEPVAALVEATHRVARDQLDVELRVHTKGEMGLLASSFNEMTSSLRLLEDQLGTVLANLEREVEARTADLRDAQQHLVRTEKLSSLGKLAASVAHEINNPLAGILTFAKLVSRTLAEGPPDETRRAALQRNLALVEREAHRCSAIVRNLLDFARERPMTPADADANAAVEEALSLVANGFKLQGLSLERALLPVPPVLADFGQLRQAIVNVVINACEAMGPGGGTLTVGTREVDGAVEIVIADTGPGIPEERLAKIFDPFFTTKEKGTGLGLSVVYGIVERHGGKVSVASAVGRGTTFTLRLPLPAPRAPAAAAG